MSVWAIGSSEGLMGGRTTSKVTHHFLQNSDVQGLLAGDHFVSCHSRERKILSEKEGEILARWNFQALQPNHGRGIASLLPYCADCKQISSSRPHSRKGTT